MPAVCWNVHLSCVNHYCQESLKVGTDLQGYTQRRAINWRGPNPSALKLVAPTLGTCLDQEGALAAKPISVFPGRPQGNLSNKGYTFGPCSLVPASANLFL